MTLMMTSLIQMQVHQGIMVHRHFRSMEMNPSIMNLCLRMVRNRTLQINRNKKKKKNLKKIQIIPFLTLDYTDLVIDDSQWCLLSQDQKTCRNTASFSAPRLIDGSPVTLWNVESSSAIGMSYSVSDQQHHKEKEPEAVLARATPEERIGTTLAASNNSIANQLKVQEPPG